MSLQDLFKCLEAISNLGSPGWTTLEAVADVLVKVRQLLKLNKEESCLEVLPEENDNINATKQRVLTVYSQLVSNVPSDVTEITERLECGCIAMAIMHEVLHQISIIECSESLSPSPLLEDRQRVKHPQAPPGLISVFHTKVVEKCMSLVVYTLMIGCLGGEARLYLKTSLARAKFVLGTDMLNISPPCAVHLLTAIMKLIIPIMKHESLGAGVRNNLFPELLTTLLELCFSPELMKNQPEDTAYFREQLEDIMRTMDSTTILRHLLFLLGFLSKGSWLGRACGALVVRRFLTQPGGVAAVVGAGLTVCNGHDWRHCEAVASIIAHAKTRYLKQYYCAVGPQICKLLMEDKLKGDVMRVMVLTVAQLATRSQHLTATHITAPLLRILIQTTLPNSANDYQGTNVTPYVAQIYKIFVEIPPPNPSLTFLLQPVLCPLVKIAAMPTTHLRSTTRHILVRYLSQLSREQTVDALFIMSSLNICPESPPVIPNIDFTVDEDGGVKTKLKTSQKNNALENVENLSKCLISILELLKCSSVVIMFYKRLTEYIDFTVFNKKSESCNTLLTDEDLLDEKFDKMHQIVLSCSLLENLSESEAVTNDLFMNLSAVVPVVSALIRVGCQECKEEQLQGIQTSLIMNVLLLVSCYVSDRSIKKKMSSEDWIGLKELLPVLEEIKGNTNDEAVLSFTEQLKSLVLTHGAINSCPTAVSQAKIYKEFTDSKFKEKDHFTKENSISQTIPNVLTNAGTQVKRETRSRTLKEVKANNTNLDNVETYFDDHIKGIKSLTKTEAVETESVSSNINKTKTELLSKLESNVDNVGLSIRETSTSSENSMKEEGTYKEAMEDLFSPLVPVRGHALLALGKLLEKRDKETLTHRAKLLSIFQHNIKEDDSYLYLMAVEGLAVLCDVFPDKVVETLTTEFSVGNRSCEDRAKLTEVLVRATRRLGPLLPQYRDTFINALLNGMRAEEDMVRASSLSALGEVCKLLRFSVGPVIHEVFRMLYDVVRNDKAAEVRRAAVLVVTLLLQGLGEDTLKVLRDVMRDLYRVLRLVHSTDPDPVVRLHTQLAMEEIDTATRQFLMPRLALTKRIYVTEPRMDM